MLESTAYKLFMVSQGRRYIASPIASSDHNDCSLYLSYWTTQPQDLGFTYPSLAQDGKLKSHPNKSWAGSAVDATKKKATGHSTGVCAVTLAVVFVNVSIFPSRFPVIQHYH